MSDQTASVVFDPEKTSADQLIGSFADAKAANESRFALVLVAGGESSEPSAGEGDSGNDFAVPPGTPDFGASSAAQPPAPSSGGDFDVSLEAPAE